MSIISALQEFSYAVKVISPIMQPSVPRAERRKALCKMIDELSEDTFKRGIIISRIFKMNMIDMSEGICSKYNDTKLQTDAVIEWLPRVKQHRKKLYKAVENARKSYGLKI